MPGLPGYDEKKRRSIFLASKTYLRYAKGEVTDPKVRSRSDGEGLKERGAKPVAKPV